MTDSASNGRSVYLVGVGGCTSIGLTMPASAAAVRAGISSFRDHPFMVDTGGEPMVVARASHLTEDLIVSDRFVELAMPAALEVLAILSGQVNRAPRLRFIVGLPSLRPGLPDAIASEITSRLQTLIAGHFPIATVEPLPFGHSAGLMALEAAWNTIKSGEEDLCVVGGVDSYLEPSTLEWLEECEQLNSAEPRNNAWGFIPGEAAGFCLLASAKAASAFRLPVLGQVDGVAIAREQNLIKTDTVCLGRGLTEAFERVFEYLPSPSKIDEIMCDLNGEPYRGDEFGFATLRTAGRFVDSADFLAPADCWGDVGAASGPLLVNLAVIAANKGYAKGPRVLIGASSESGERAAALLHFPVPGSVRGA